MFRDYQGTVKTLLSTILDCSRIITHLHCKFNKGKLFKNTGENLEEVLD
jgi:hypothetical protein